jgi:hypothetical protein
MWNFSTLFFEYFLIHAGFQVSVFTSFGGHETYFDPPLSRYLTLIE